MDVNLNCSDIETLIPHRALMVYTGAHSAVAMDHELVGDGRGGVVLGAGTPLSREAVTAALNDLAGSVQGEVTVIPPYLLAADRDVMAWWRPEHRHPIWFESGGAIDKELSGRWALHPALVFVARPPVDGYARLMVYALRDSVRPDASTQLLRAPYWNLYPSGLMCSGTAPLPDRPRPENIPVWERAFYESSFVHTGMTRGSVLTVHPDGHDGLWRELTTTECRHFPVCWLVAATPRSGHGTITLGEAIQRS